MPIKPARLAFLQIPLFLGIYAKAAIAPCIRGWSVVAILQIATPLFDSHPRILSPKFLGGDTPRWGGLRPATIGAHRDRMGETAVPQRCTFQIAKELSVVAAAVFIWRRFPCEGFRVTRVLS
jgi:hypothetical protein